MRKPIKRIIIVGGGSAGWMSAAVLCKRFPEMEIAVVESPDIPIIGVGESTLGSINAFLDILELKDTDWMAECNATHKLAIKFRNFHKIGEEFYYPFGSKDVNSTTNGIQDWYIKKTVNPDTPWNDFYDCFYPQMPLIYQNKICDNSKNQLSGFNFQNDVAYHMDAALFGQYLKEKYCIPRGVVFINEHIDDITMTPDGYVDSLVLRNGDIIDADLYVDCSGFKSMLLEEKMKVPFQSFESWLPNDYAWTCHIPYTDKEIEMENVTNCTAIQAGWVWNIPLYHRIGSGYVFCSKFSKIEDALQDYKDYLDGPEMSVVNPNRSKNLEFKLIKIKNGIHDRCWKNNVVAVGLSYGFIEPLESTGLLSVQEILVLLCETLAVEQVNRIHIDNFNYIANVRMNGFKMFVAYHYTLSARRDNGYWRHVTENIVMDGRVYDKYVSELRTIVNDYATRLLKTHEFGEDMGGMPDILVGMHNIPMNAMAFDWHNYAMKVQHGAEPMLFQQPTQIYWNRRTAYSNKIANESPSHYQYLKHTIYNGKE
jgi:tryptophan halogenase